MDLSIFERTDLESQIKILSASQFSSNTNPNVVTLCAFTGATDARQKESFNSAYYFYLANLHNDNTVF